MTWNYDVSTASLGVGMCFRFIVYNYNTEMSIGDFVKEMEYWCIDNIGDNLLYDVFEIMTGCQVVIYDDIHATAFKLRWI